MATVMSVWRRLVNSENKLPSLCIYKKLVCFHMPFFRRKSHSQSGEISSSTSQGNAIYHVFKTADGNVPVAKFISALKETGLRMKDPRLKETLNHFKQYLQHHENFEGFVDEATFRRSIQENIVLIENALAGDFVLPKFGQFTKHIKDIYLNCKENINGKVADYIPQLAKFDPNLWGVAVCSVDGQRFAIGDYQEHFCLQSISKCLHYPIVLEDLSAETVHQYVGHEPSGQTFNYLHLNSNDQPHNPMLNSGAMVLCALQKPELPLAERCDYVQNKFKQIAGGKFVGFSNATFLSERETADKNYALGYYMNANKAFPPNTNLMDTFELYFHTCSIETNCDAGSLMAATLANGGICPLTGQKIFGSQMVQHTLSLMLSCGMYDYSGEFAFHVGLPAKSGVSGAILIVVPKVCGIMVWSPPLDLLGNSVRGIQFCKELVNLFNFHKYDLKGDISGRKIDPRKKQAEVQGEKVVPLLYAASNGDVTALRRYYLSGNDMTQQNYDGRTALHVAAAEGHQEAVSFLLEQCHVPVDPKDRWDFSPLDEAVRFQHKECEDIIRYHLKFQETADFSRESSFNNYS
ncbi:glutaminase kidney isoform, mitochondrial-like isoform X1 [Acropora muricata]|uniref:glutaminase kidney isoform, mitochondrial-like isoform X1 n=2 Tax=Acropora muricata TaxID=159855 RepID=UPI0034E55A76